MCSINAINSLINMSIDIERHPNSMVSVFSAFWHSIIHVSLWNYYLPYILYTHRLEYNLTFFSTNLSVFFALCKVNSVARFEEELLLSSSSTTVHKHAGSDQWVIILTWLGPYRISNNTLVIVGFGQSNIPCTIFMNFKHLCFSGKISLMLEFLIRSLHTYQRV